MKIGNSITNRFYIASYIIRKVWIINWKKKTISLKIKISTFNCK